MSIAQRINEVSRLTGTFTMRSGAVSSTYFDKYQFEADPVLLHDIASLLAQKVPDGTEVIAGLEMGGIPVVTALSQVTGLPAAFIRKERKKYGTANYAEGAPLEGKRVVLIEDVVSSGGAILDALAMLNADGVHPTLALCVIDRETGGKEALDAVGVELVPLVLMRDLENAA